MAEPLPSSHIEEKPKKETRQMQLCPCRCGGGGVAADRTQRRHHNVTSLLISCYLKAVAGVLDEPYSQLIPLIGVAVQARQSTQA
jgi:hypothetical protein